MLHLSTIIIVLILNVQGSFCFGPRDHLQAKQQTQVEVEWLLEQLVQILSKFASDVETDPTLLESHVFRQVLIRVMFRITEVIDRVEKMPNISTRMSATVSHLDAVRVRISNYVSNYIYESYDQMTTHKKKIKITTTTQKPNNDMNEVMSILSEVLTKLQSMDRNHK